jgi:hypothetical protein
MVVGKHVEYAEQCQTSGNTQKKKMNRLKTIFQERLNSAFLDHEKPPTMRFLDQKSQFSTNNQKDTYISKKKEQKTENILPDHGC